MASLEGNESDAYFSDITDSELDAVVEAIQNNSPRSGAVLVWGELKSHGISVSRRRVRESLVQVNPTGVELRASTCVVFAALTAYHVPMLCGTLMVFIALYDGGLSERLWRDTLGCLSPLLLSVL